MRKTRRHCAPSTHAGPHPVGGRSWWAGSHRHALPARGGRRGAPGGTRTGSGLPPAHGRRPARWMGRRPAGRILADKSGSGNRPAATRPLPCVRPWAASDGGFSRTPRRRPVVPSEAVASAAAVLAAKSGTRLPGPGAARTVKPGPPLGSPWPGTGWAIALAVAARIPNAADPESPALYGGGNMAR